MSLENDDLEELTGEIKRLIASNKAFLDRLNDDEYQESGDEEDADPADGALEDYEEL